ncbi:MULTISPECIES: SusD/RagB family nutrient-binding outer membrane lipoprotein [unclassified Pedobacter]|uniref:SusD/RagB family nutrient-binding outer membrane lipoprotein n=1 Tax=unclassified Pedobacter TaxID=2628915 RepID=UPI001E50ADF0|nr:MULTISPECIES: SusD/RagB family nutrient-binding outer membrane lipoprotein [unclassified Pedobacter]
MKQKITYIVMLLLILTSLGCKKFGDLNVDPTRSSNLDPASQLMYTQVYFSGDLGIQERTNYFMLIPMMQQFAGAFNMSFGAVYKKTPSYLWRMFDESYQNDVVNIVDAVERSKGVANQTNLNAMCRIMKVYIFARLTDTYGDIPYFEAGKGSTGQIRPKFDAQKDIYYDFFKELAEASAQLDAAKDRVPNEYFYKGNISAWKKFANSLRLRLALRLAKRDPEKGKAEIQAAYAGGVFTSNADICMTRHENVPNSYQDPRPNGISAAWNSKNEMGRVVNTFLNALTVTNDPRVNHLIKCYREFNPVAPTRFLEREDITAQVRAKIGLVGAIPGRYNSDDVLSTTAITLANGTSYTPRSIDLKPQLNHNLLRNDAPFFHITYAEVELLLADATQRFGLNLGGTAQEHYYKGVEAAMQQLSLYPGGPVVTATEINNFKTANPLVVGRELEQINTQLWIALLLNGNETYANWRRSGFPVLVPSPTTESVSQTIPRRFEYPLSEKQQNAANVEAAIKIIGTDDWTKRVWWDQE